MGSVEPPHGVDLSTPKDCPDFFLIPQVRITKFVWAHLLRSPSPGLSIPWEVPYQANGRLPNIGRLTTGQDCCWLPRCLFVCWMLGWLLVFVVAAAVYFSFVVVCYWCCRLLFDVWCVLKVAVCVIQVCANGLCYPVGVRL